MSEETNSDNQKTPLFLAVKFFTQIDFTVSLKENFSRVASNFLISSASNKRRT